MNKRKRPKDTIDEMLQDIKKVEVPMFLYTKIQARINQKKEEYIAAKYVWIGAFSLMILLVLNVWTIQESTIQTEDSIAIMVEEMDLIPSNSFF